MTRELSDLVPNGILSQLGPEAMAQLKRLAEQLQQGGGLPGMPGAGAGGEEDEAVPELVEADETNTAAQEESEVNTLFLSESSIRVHLTNSFTSFSM